MTPQEADDALARMDQWQGMSNDEAHDLLRTVLEDQAQMRAEYGVAYGEQGRPLWEPWTWHDTIAAAQREATRVMEDADVVQIVRRLVSPSIPVEDGDQ